MSTPEKIQDPLVKVLSESITKLAKINNWKRPTKSIEEQLKEQQLQQKQNSPLNYYWGEQKSKSNSLYEDSNSSVASYMFKQLNERNLRSKEADFTARDFGRKTPVIGVQAAREASAAPSSSGQITPRSAVSVVMQDGIPTSNSSPIARSGNSRNPAPGSPRAAPSSPGQTAQQALDMKDAARALNAGEGSTPPEQEERNRKRREERDYNIERSIPEFKDDLSTTSKLASGAWRDPRGPFKGRGEAVQAPPTQQTQLPQQSITQFGYQFRPEVTVIQSGEAGSAAPGSSGQTTSGSAAPGSPTPAARQQAAAREASAAPGSSGQTTSGSAARAEREKRDDAFFAAMTEREKRERETGPSAAAAVAAARESDPAAFQGEKAVGTEPQSQQVNPGPRFGSAAPGNSGQITPRSAAPGNSGQITPRSAAPGSSGQTTPRSAAPGSSGQTTPRSAAPGSSGQTTSGSAAPGSSGQTTSGSAAPGSSGQTTSGSAAKHPALITQEKQAAAAEQAAAKRAAEAAKNPKPTDVD